MPVLPPAIGRSWDQRRQVAFTRRVQGVAPSREARHPGQRSGNAGDGLLRIGPGTQSDWRFHRQSAAILRGQAALRLEACEHGSAQRLGGLPARGLVCGIMGRGCRPRMVGWVP